jgi:enoyl-CoA hydratase/carnithine racemase
MACTIRVAAEHAKFGQPEVKLGVLPGAGGTQRLPRLVGKGRALQLILSGEMISAQEAWRIGLVNEVIPAAELLARREAILTQILANAPAPYGSRSKRSTRVWKRASPPGCFSRPLCSRSVLLQGIRPKAPRPSSQSARRASRASESQRATIFRSHS